MNSDSASGAAHYMPISPEKYDEDDFMTKLLSLDEDHVSKITQAYDNSRIDMEPQPNPSNSSGQYEEISKLLNGSNFARTFEELMHVKKEADALLEKLKRAEKEKTELQLKIDVLMAENYQIKYLKKQHDEINQKVNELQEDLANKLETYQKLKKEAKSSYAQLSEKSKAVRKEEKNKKRLLSMLKQFAQKLESADLLTMKERNNLKKFEEHNSVESEDAFDSDD